MDILMATRKKVMVTVMDIKRNMADMDMDTKRSMGDMVATKRKVMVMEDTKRRVMVMVMDITKRKVTVGGGKRRGGAGDGAVGIKVAMKQTIYIKACG